MFEAGLEAAARLPLAALAHRRGFVADARFSGIPVEDPPAIDAAPEPIFDPIAEALTQGYAAGAEATRAEFAARHAADEAARERLALAFTRIDAALEEELRLRLRDTVVALCEAVVAPLSLDAELLARRVATAAAMLARADDERVIRLHPDDLALVAPRLAAEWTVQDDPTLERGTVRVEGAAGGVEDGPATWRRAIAEALHAC
jgi:flagellar assembly protein FliH